MAAVLKEPYFKAALFLASKSLYQELEKADFDYHNLNGREITSLRKYFNRMCFRPTPFGLFAGFSTSNWGKSKGPLIIGHQLKIHRYLDYKRSLVVAREMISYHLTSSEAYSVNSTLYLVNNEYRYLRYQEHPQEDIRKFFIDAIEQSKPLNAVLNACAPAKKKKDLSKLLVAQLPFSQKEIEAYLDRLIKEQILVPTLEPNITGEDYLKRVLKLCDRMEDSEQYECVLPLNKLSGDKGVQAFFTDGIPTGGITNDYRRQNTPELTRKLSSYVVLEKPEVTGEFDTAYQKKILEGLDCIHRLLPAQTPPALQIFASAYTARYDRRAVSLLEAMDPEIGIGYESLAEDYTSSLLLKNMNIQYPATDTRSIEWSGIHAFLMEKIQSGEQTIYLTQAEIDNLHGISVGHNLPPSISVLFRPCRDMVYIEQAGGATATSLLGRFTLFSDQVLSICKETVSEEEKANPDIIFAEIAHVCNMHSANIERRRAVRPYEIPVLTGTAAGLGSQILLSDLTLMVSGNEIILWSKKHKKRVIPRLTSAFNYKRSKLAIYRFLCDLQYQSLKANLSFDLSWFFPGLTYYPRVAYKSAILHLATWHIKKDQLRNIIEQKSNLNKAIKLRRFAEEFRWPRYISLNNHDHQLIFDTRDEGDIRFLAEVLGKQPQDVLIKEFPFAEDNVPAVMDRDNKPYAAQFVASLYQEKPVYQIPEYPFSTERPDHLQQRIFVAGSDWLYVKLYCHPSRSNELLIECILPIVEDLKVKKLLKKWFFIRYQDAGYHLRIRFEVGPLNIAELLSRLNTRISDLVSPGIISRFQLDVYKRELERYSPDLIEDIENVFCKSSTLILHYLKDRVLHEKDSEYFRFGFSNIDQVFKVFEWSAAERANMLNLLYLSFYEEFQGSRTLKEQLKRKHRELSTEGIFSAKPLNDFFSKPESCVIFSEFEDSLTVIKDKTNNWDLTRKQVLIADLIHMQLNRLLVDNHRKHELIIYYCLWKEYTSIAARMKLGQPLTF